MLALADPLGGNGGGYPGRGELAVARVSGQATPPVSCRIIRTEEQTSVLLQKYMAYVIEVVDFGRKFEISHRFSEFQELHTVLTPVAPGLPGMPPKGVDGTDPQVVQQRRQALDNLLQWLMKSVEALTEKNLVLWKFLELPNPAIICGRFVILPQTRETNARMMLKLLQDDKYKEDVYRLSHQSLLDIWLDWVRDLNSPTGGEMRKVVCQLLQGALQRSETARTYLLDQDCMGIFLAIVEKSEAALDDIRTVLNVIVAREGKRFGQHLKEYCERGGFLQLTTLARSVKCQEFAAKLLWLNWDTPLRVLCAVPGTPGWKLIGTLMAAQPGPCQTFGALLLAVIIAQGDLDGDADTKSEALRFVADILSVPPPEALDPLFAKALCGVGSTSSRIAVLLDNPLTTTLVMALLCRARPPAQQLAKLSGNIAALLSGGGVPDEARARSAELLLYIRSEVDDREGAVALDRCEGLSQYEGALAAAISWQLQDAMAARELSMQSVTLDIEQQELVARARLVKLPDIGGEFRAFDKSLSKFIACRTEYEDLVRDLKNQHTSITGRIASLRAAKLDTAGDAQFTEKLLEVERWYGQLKEKRETLGGQEGAVRVAEEASEASRAQLRRAEGEASDLGRSADDLTRAMVDKDTEASSLRSRACMPNLDGLKDEIGASLAKNDAKMRELQRFAQGVQQGDPDYLKDGESRDGKMAQLQQRHGALKREKQELEQKLSGLKFDPTELLRKADAIAAEVQGMRSQIDALNAKRSEAEELRDECRLASQRDMERLRRAQDARQVTLSQASSLEERARSLMAAVQPQMRNRHQSWQRELATKDTIDADYHRLTQQIRTISSPSDAEVEARNILRSRIGGLVQKLQHLDDVLCGAGTAQAAIEDGTRLGAEVPVPELVAAPPSSASVLGGPAAPAPPSSASVFGETEKDDFEKFLEQDLDTPIGQAASSPQEAATTVTLDDEFEF